MFASGKRKDEERKNGLSPKIAHCKGCFTWSFLSADISQGKKKKKKLVQKCKTKTEHLRSDITLN